MPDLKQTETLHHSHDTSYRFLFSSKKLFVELLRSFVQLGWVDEIREADLEPVPCSFILQDFRKKEADLVYQAKLRGQEVLVYILTEFQSRVDYLMPYRLLLYQVEVWRYWLEQQPKAAARSKSFRLPPIIPIVLYNGKRSWTASRRFRQVIARENLFGSHLIDFEYILLDVVRYKEQDLLELANTIGSVFMLEQAKDRTDLQNRLSQLMGVIKQLPEDNRERLFTWMDGILAKRMPGSRKSIANFIFENKGGTAMSLEQTLDSMFRKARKEARMEGLAEGRAKGRAEGKTQGKTEVTRKLLEMGLDPEAIAAATGFTPEEVKKLGKPPLS